MEAATPKKPLTPFFLFLEKEREKGNSMSAKDAGEKWHSMSDAEKKPYLDEYQKAREKFDAYLEAEGLTPKKSSMRKSGLPPAYKGSRIKALLGMSEEVKKVEPKQCSALARVAVPFFSLSLRQNNLFPQ